MWASFDEKCSLCHKNGDKTARVAHVASTHNHAEDTKPVHHCHMCLKSQVFVSIFTTIMVLSAQELFATEKVAIAGTGKKKIATTLGLPQSTKKRWLQRLRSEGEMVSHSVGRSRGVEAGLCLAFLAFLVSRLSNCT